MKYALSLSNRDHYGDIHLLVELAVLAEQAGWDGFFIWDHIASGLSDHVDPWITMAAVASNTKNMRLGIHITPLSRRRPWKVAREIVTLDHLSHGRMILGVGLGDFKRKEFENFGEVSDQHQRGKMLDEALEIITGLQTCRAYRFSGEHFQVSQPTTFRPEPVQKPHIPVWVAGQWPNRPPFRRAANWDGVIPLAKGRAKKEFLKPAEIEDMMTYISKTRTIETPLEICLSGVMPGKTPSQKKAVLGSYTQVGVTWWAEFIYSQSGSVSENKERIKLGPPR